MNINGIESKHVTWFVEGAMMGYYRDMNWCPKEYARYTDETIEKVWRYLTDSLTSIDGSYSDIQAHLSLEAGKVFNAVALRYKR